MYTTAFMRVMLHGQKYFSMLDLHIYGTGYTFKLGCNMKGTNYAAG